MTHFYPPESNVRVVFHGFPRLFLLVTLGKFKGYRLVERGIGGRCAWKTPSGHNVQDLYCFKVSELRSWNKLAFDIVTTFNRWEFP